MKKMGKSRNIAVIAALAGAMTLGGMTVAEAQSIAAFQAVGQKTWSYEAMHQLVKEGCVPGATLYEHPIQLTRYDMAMLVARAAGAEEAATPEQREVINRLENEYSTELKGIYNMFGQATASDVAAAGKDGALQKKPPALPRVDLHGNVHMRWDSDKSDGVTGSTDGRHMYMSLEGTMQVNKDWAAHFQTENKNRYVSHLNQGDETEFGQRIWMTGKVGKERKIGVEAGRRWWWIGQGLMFAHSMDGVKVDVPVGKGWTVTPFFMHSDGVKNRTDKSDGKGGNYSSYMALGDYGDANFVGVVAGGPISRKAFGSLMLGGNAHTYRETEGEHYADVTRWGEIGASWKFDKNWRIDAAYARTNADDYNDSWRFGLNYKGMQGAVPGTYGIGLNYLHLGRYGDLLHDDFWGYQWSDSNILSLSMEYTVAPHLIWKTYYSWQKRNLSGLGGYFDAISMDYARKDVGRRIFFTELAAYF